MRYKWFSCMLVLLASTLCSLHAQQVIISGLAPSYTGEKLVFYDYPDWITGYEEAAGKCTVDSTGNFRIQIDLKTIKQIVVNLGVYKGYFFAEPGMSYKLVLPEKKEKSQQDILNPYFEPEEIHLGIQDLKDNDLNLLVQMFDNTFYPYFNKHVDNLYARTDDIQVQSDISSMEQPFRNSGNQYFNDYRRYRYAMLNLFANQQKVQRLSDEYFNNQPVLYDNPAYGDLFNRVFDKYFMFFGRSDSGKKIYRNINQEHSLDSLLKTLKETAHFSNDTLTELVILKQIHDEYYSSNFSRSGLLEILDSLAAGTNNERHHQLCVRIRQKLISLQAGYTPPQFELISVSGDTVKLSDFSGEYVYLNFCTCQSYACLNEFNLLRQIKQKYKEKLAVVTVITDPADENLIQFLQKNTYDWTFLYYNNHPEILREYDIRTYPTYFLIGKDGKLIQSPAPSPSENFELKLFEIMRARGDL